MRPQCRRNPANRCRICSHILNLQTAEFESLPSFSPMIVRKIGQRKINRTFQKALSLLIFIVGNHDTRCRTFQSKTCCLLRWPLIVSSVACLAWLWSGSGQSAPFQHAIRLALGHPVFRMVRARTVLCTRTPSDRPVTCSLRLRKRTISVK